MQLSNYVIHARIGKIMRIRTSNMHACAFSIVVSKIARGDAASNAAVRKRSETYRKVIFLKLTQRSHNVTRYDLLTGKYVFIR